MQMSSTAPFKNAPITEALLDIRVSLPSGSDYATLEPFCEQIATDYPTRRFRREWQAEIAVSDESAPVTSATRGGTVGYLLTSPDGTQVVQARINGFSLSRLRPYRNWIELKAEAQKLWEVYRKVANPLAIDQIALRYVNRIEIPAPFTDFREYVLTAPDIAPGLPQGLSHFLMQLVVPFPAFGANATITETIAQSNNDSTTVPFILDIDVARVGAIDVEDPSVWEQFEQLRELKNDVFFKSTTDKARELFV